MTTITRRDDRHVAAPSYAQELLWHLDRAAPGLTAYNVPRVIRIRGAVDVGALESALDSILARHEILRTTYATVDGVLVQRIHPHSRLRLDVVDVSSHADAAAEAERIAHAAARTPFDLGADLFLRAQLVRVADAEHLLVLVSHHIASDGWSRDVLFTELSAFYQAAVQGGDAELPPLAIQFADFAAWQRARGESSEMAEQVAYWMDRLAGAPVLQLPTTYPRPAVAGFEGSREVLTLDAEFVRRLRAFAADNGATMYMVLLAAYQSLLQRYTGQEDIIVGSPVAARDLPEIEPLIGYFANMLAMRTSFADDPTFAELVGRVVDGSIDAFDHAEVPFEQIQLRLREQGLAAGDAPLVRAVLTMEDTHASRLTLGAADVEIASIDYGQAKFDLTLLVAEREDGLRLSLWYRTDLFDAAFARAALAHLRTLLDAALTAPATRVSRLALVTSTEREALREMGVGSAARAALRRVDAWIAEHARATPERVAVRSGSAAVSYRELDRRATVLAARLRDVGARECVGLCDDRSIDAIVSIVAILRAGCAYVPLVPQLPLDRLRQQASESGISVVVCSSATEQVASAIATVVVRSDDVDTSAAPARAAQASQLADGSLAYVLFTSGSTGVPKGVAVTHENLAAYVDAIVERLDIPQGRGWTFGLISSLAADLGNTVLFPALATGGTLDVIPAAAALDPSAFADYVAANPIDVLKITPSHLQALTSGAAGLRALPKQRLVFGGESLPIAFARDVAGRGSLRIFNHYGPTETTVGCCAYELDPRAIPVTPSGSVPIGRPLRGVRAHVVDAAGAPAPREIPGELWIAGTGVAAGYVGHPEWTAERFVAEPGRAGSLAYRTGDRVRWLASGELEFLGRIDHQVKVRGYRVELEELEAVVARHPGVARAVVVARGDDANRHLAAFVEGTADVDVLRAALSATLPEYMVPAELTTVTEWPLTRSGKIDRAALITSAETAAPSVAPRTATELRLAEIWRTVLKRDDIGIHDSFFDLGGHSLLAIRVLGRISRDLGVRLPLRTLFDAVTIEALARVVDEALRPADDEAALREALAAVAALSETQVSAMLQDSGEGQR